MGERIPASIQFGGKLKAEFVPELIELLNEQGLLADDDEPCVNNLGKEFSDNEVNYGNLDSLISFAIKHNLAYVHWFDSGAEWMSATDKRDLSGRNAELVGSRYQGFYLSEQQIDQGKELLAWMREPLPPLEIVE